MKTKPKEWRSRDWPRTKGEDFKILTTEGASFSVAAKADIIDRRKAGEPFGKDSVFLRVSGTWTEENVGPGNTTFTFQEDVPLELESIRAPADSVVVLTLKNPDLRADVQRNTKKDQKAMPQDQKDLLHRNPSEATNGVFADFDAVFTNAGDVDGVYLTGKIEPVEVTAEIWKVSLPAPATAPPKK